MQRFSILVLVLYITFIGGTAYSANNLILRMVYQVAVTAVIVMWLLILAWKRRSWPRTPFDLPLLAYVTLLGVTTAASQEWRVSLEQSWSFLMHVVWFYLLVDVMRQGRQRWVFEALFMTAGVLIIISTVEVVSWYFGTGFAGFKQGWFEIGGLRDPIPVQGHEVSLALNVSTILGNYAALLLPVIIVWSITAKQADHRLGLALLSIGVLVVLVGSGSRGSMIALVGAAGVMGSFWLLRQRRFTLLFSPKLILAGLVMFITILGILVILFATHSTNSSDQRRVDMWESALDMVEADPLTGVGVYQFGAEYRFTRDKTMIQDKLVAAHNLWLNTAAEIGVGGLLILFWLGGLFLKVWWQTWKNVGERRKIRLEGILAALVGFCLHSLIDTFTLSASVLPILIYSTYVLEGEAVPRQQLQYLYRGISYVALILAVGFFIWLMQLDIAGIYYMKGLAQLNQEKYEQSREYLNQAQLLDPHLSLYHLQEANLLGLMANEDPEAYLDSAIQVHLNTLKDNPTFDIGYANLAALYAEKGDFDQAVIYIQKAADIHPDYWEYWLKLGEYQRAADQPAIESYQQALALNPLIVRSDYWKSRPEILEDVYPLLPAAPRTLVAIHSKWSEKATEEVTKIRPQHYWDYVALAHYAIFIGDEESAIQWYSEALEKKVGKPAQFYAERAEVHLKIGNEEKAKEDALTAIFINPIEGSRGYYVLAQLSDEDEKTINDYLIRAVIPGVSVQEYASAVYARPARLNWLPQLMLPGQGRTAFEPWFLLAERYATDEDENTDPADVYNAIQESNPYMKLN